MMSRDTESAAFPVWTISVPVDQDYDPNLCIWDKSETGSKDEFENGPKQITIILDASGSTFNFSSRGRGAGFTRFHTPSFPPDYGYGHTFSPTSATPKVLKQTTSPPTSPPPPPPTPISTPPPPPPPPPTSKEGGSGAVPVGTKVPPVSAREAPKQATGTALTKPIIFSEMEACILALNRLHRKFDLTGTALNYYVFSDECHLAYQMTMTDPSRQLREFAERMKVLTPPWQGGTRTKQALSQIGASGHLSDAIVILATDGQPTDDSRDGVAEGTYGGCASIVAQYRNSDWIVIGAGSIADKSGSGSLAVCRDGSYQIGDRSMLRRASTVGGAECNTFFLATIIETSSTGVYLPACRDRVTGEYAILHNAMDNYFDRETRYSVVLDHGLMEYSHEISKALSDGKVVLENVPGRGWYLITTKFQLAVKEIGDLPVKPIAIDMPPKATDEDSVLHKSYRDICNLHSLELEFNTWKLTAKTNGGKICIRQVMGTNGTNSTVAAAPHMI